MPRRRRDDSGAAAVEFALVMPIFFGIVFAIIAYGMVFAQSLSLSNAARQAARSGVIEGTTCDQIRTLAKDSSATLGMAGDDVEPPVIELGLAEGSTSPACSGEDPPCNGRDPGTNIYVTLTYHVTPIVPFVPVPDTLTGTGVYRCEFS